MVVYKNFFLGFQNLAKNLQLKPSIEKLFDLNLTNIMMGFLKFSIVSKNMKFVNKAKEINKHVSHL